MKKRTQKPYKIKYINQKDIYEYADMPWFFRIQWSHYVVPNEEIVKGEIGAVLDTKERIVVREVSK